MKNQVIQAVAAIEFAEKINKPLRFHVNGTRVEGNGEPVLKNLRLLFTHFPKHKLIEHPWRPHNEFLELIGKMDISMQVSFSETFNIITADAVSMGIPIVVSPEIKWVDYMSHANPNDTDSIVNKLNAAYGNYYLPTVNKHLLKQYSKKSKDIWLDFLKIK